MVSLVALLFNGLAFGSLLAVLALGFALSYWPSRHFHFAFGAVFLVGAYGFWVAMDTVHLPFLVSVAVAAGASVVTGVGSYIVFYRPLKDENVVFLTSFAVAILIQNVVQLVFTADPHAVNSRPEWLSGSISLVGIPVATTLGLQFLVCITLWAIVEVFLRRSRTGVAIRALSSDPFLTEAVGIDPRRLLLIAYSLGSILAAAAGILFALDFGINPAIGFEPLFYAIMAVLLGGAMSMTGAAAGGLLLGVLVNISIWQLPSQWQQAIAFGAIFAVLIVRPQGLLGKKA